VIEIHAEILAWMIAAVWRFPDILICGCHWMIASESRQPTPIRLRDKSPPPQCRPSAFVAVLLGRAMFGEPIAASA
jgi:hypothetical protein